MLLSQANDSWAGNAELRPDKRAAQLFFPVATLLA